MVRGMSRRFTRPEHGSQVVPKVAADREDMSETPNSEQWPLPQHPTEPIAPPSGFVDTVEPTDPPADDWPERLAKERRKTQIFMGTTALAGALLVGSLFYASAQGSADNAAMRDGSDAMGQAPGMGGPGMGRDLDDDGQGMGRGMPGSGAVPQGGGLVQQFFASDGSINDDAVAQFKQRADALAAVDQDGDQIAAMQSHLLADIQQAVSSGTITQDQADELVQALDLPADGSSTSGTNSRTT
jgi:hypothetical protein